MTDPMHDRCPALEPGTGERCVLYAKHVSDRTGVHVATGSWPIEPEGTDEELTALVTDAVAVGKVARRYARLYSAEAHTVHAAVEATLELLKQRQQVEGSTPIASPPVAGLNVHTAEVPDDTIIVGDFGEFARAAREGRSVNPKAFAAIKNVAAPAGEVVSVPPPAMITIELELLKAFYDMAVGSMDYSSGFFDSTETDQIAYVGRLLGVDQTPPDEPTPHLWHQDCALPWRCGQSAGAEIHRMEMPNA